MACAWWRTLRGKLRGEGIEPHLYRWNLAPGMRWRAKLEEHSGHRDTDRGHLTTADGAPKP
jgi:hypothetical protein